ncbi:putative TonB-dependent receptor [Cupriavidus basilensis OR16]|uniref:Putative TonB-dependent receptor n=1 Tax=Cupriavidus basilensis OR16 TaxID=1127483 RepID=H1RZ75_9BURK|nr:putative TonB-dependent receptor [Cupriavidus basilensis OR16]
MQRQGKHIELAPVTVTGTQAPSSKVEGSGSAKYAAPLLDTPQTITVVPQHVLEEQNALSLRQALSNVSGITFNAGEGGGGSGDSINIRGFSANANMQIDGLRDSGQNNRSDLFNLEAVEVIKGPNSVFGGAGTTGGSINMISKQPKADRFTHVGGGVGTARFRRLTLDTNQPLPWGENAAVVRLNLMAHENDVPGRDALERRLAPTRLTLSYFHQSDDNLPDYGVPALNGQRLAGVSRHSYFGWRNVDRENIATDAATVKFEHEFNDNLKLQNLTRYSHLHRDTVISASHVNQRGLPPGRYLPAGPQGYGRDSATELWINQTNLTSRFATLGLGHTLVSGFEISRETYNRTTYSYNLAKYYPANGFDLSNPPGYWSAPTDRRDSARNKTWLDVKALYALDTIALGKHWDLNLGLRYDWIDGSAESTPLGKSTDRADSTTNQLSSRAGLVFKPTDNGRIYFAYGTSFNPSAEFLVSTGSGVSKATGDLAPEKNKTYELGSKWEFMERRLGLNAALFQVDKDNTRERLADGSYALAGEQRVRGVELGAAGKVTPNWDVFANYTYLNSKTLKSLSLPEREGKALANTPAHSFSLWTTYQLPAGWTLGYGARFIGRRNVTSVGDGMLGAYLVHNAMLGYAPNKNLKFQLNVDNLFNKAYVERVRQTLGSASRSSAIEYGDGRFAVLSAVYSF